MNAQVLSGTANRDYLLNAQPVHSTFSEAICFVGLVTFAHEGARTVACQELKLCRVELQF